MGNDASKERAQQVQAELSSDEKRALQHVWELISDNGGFSELFSLPVLGTISKDISTSLPRLLQSLVSPKPCGECLHLDSIIQYQILFHKITKEMNPKARLDLYWKLFPSFTSFFTAAVILSRKEDRNHEQLSPSEQKVVQSMESWIEKEKTETFSSQLIMVDNTQKDRVLLQLFIENRVPRILLYFDKWMYHGLTKISLSCGEITFLNTEDAECNGVNAITDYPTQWWLSIMIPLQTLYVEAEESLTTRGLVDAFSKIPVGKLMLSWDLVYDTIRDGSGINRLSEAVFGYSASSLLLIETNDGSIFGGYIPSPWPRYEKQFFGDERCFLVSITGITLVAYPSLGMSQNFIRFPDKERRNEKQLGIGFGGQRGYERIWVDGGDNFSKGKTTAMCSTYMRGVIGSSEGEYEVKRLQIWGFGGQAAIDARSELREREDKFTERSKKLDPAAFFAKGQSITENPDKMMMDWMSTKRQQ